MSRDVDEAERSCRLAWVSAGRHIRLSWTVYILILSCIHIGLSWTLCFTTLVHMYSTVMNCLHTTTLMHTHYSVTNCPLYYT